MLTRVLHRLVAIPWIYDLVQVLAGEANSERYLLPQIRRLETVRTVVDVGGGTGRVRRLFPLDALYVCLDNDLQKLGGFRSKYPGLTALLADGTSLPLRTGSIDVVVCIAVSHHLPDESIRPILAELARVVRPSGGHLVFLEPVWQPRRLVSRLLWRYDRGAFPRESRALEEPLEEFFEPIHRETFAYLHEYLFWIGRPNYTEPREEPRGQRARQLRQGRHQGFKRGQWAARHERSRTCVNLGVLDHIDSDGRSSEPALRHKL